VSELEQREELLMSPHHEPEIQEMDITPEPTEPELPLPSSSSSQLPKPGERASRRQSTENPTSTSAGGGGNALAAPTAPTTTAAAATTAVVEATYKPVTLTEELMVNHEKSQV
jgi:hypothetical protein